MAAKYDFRTIAQRGGNFGERIGSILNDARLREAGRIAIVGSDSPTIPADYIEKSLELLKRREVVLGPAFDGGVYLIGLATPFHREVLAGEISWGTEKVYFEMKEICDSYGLSTAVLPAWYDVDTVRDLHLARSHLEILTRSEQARAPHTRDCLRSMDF